MRGRFFKGLLIANLIVAVAVLVSWAYPKVQTEVTAAQLVKHLRPGDFLFQPTGGLNGAMIELVTACDITHVGMAFQKDNGEWFVFEAVQPVKETPISVYVNRSKGKIGLLRSKVPFDTDAVLAELRQHLGKRYDVLFQWDEEHMYCSEILYKALDKVADLQVGLVEDIADLPLHRVVKMDEFHRRVATRGVPRASSVQAGEIVAKHGTYRAAAASPDAPKLAELMGERLSLYYGPIITPLSMYRSPSLEVVEVWGWRLPSRK